MKYYNLARCHSGCDCLVGDHPNNFLSIRFLLLFFHPLSGGGGWLVMFLTWPSLSPFCCTVSHQDWNDLGLVEDCGGAQMTEVYMLSIDSPKV